MKKNDQTVKQLLQENEELRLRLQEAEDTLAAIREDAVDALVVSGPQGERVFTLTGGDQVYRRLVETMSEAGLTTTLDGRILFCNERFSEMLRRPMEDIIGRPMDEFVRESSRRDMADLIAGAQVKQSRKRMVFLAGDGTPVASRVSANLLHLADSESICMVAMDLTELEASEEIAALLAEQKNALEENAAELLNSRRAALNLMEDAVASRRQAEQVSENLHREIAERKQAEQALRESEQRFRALAEALPQIVWTAAADGAVEWYNRRWYEYTGKPESVGLGWDWDKIAHPDDMAGTLRNWRDALQRGALFQNDIRIRRHDGQYRWFLVRAWPLQDVSGKVLRWFGTNTDVHDFKLAEATLRQSKKDLDEAQAVGNLGSWRLDTRKNVLTWSDENHRIFGIPKGTPLTYEIFLSVVHPDDRQSVETKWKAGLAGEDYDIEHRIVVDGHIKWVREKAYLEFDEKGDLIGGFGITQDITRIRWMQEQLRQANEELEERVKQRTLELNQTVETLESEVLQRIAAQAAIQAERQRFQEVLETLPSYVCLLAPDYRMPFANRIFREWFGYDPEKKCYEFLFHRTEPCESCETYKVLNTHAPHRWEWTGPNDRIYDVYDFPFKDSSGSRFILEMGTDITERRKAEQAVRDYQKTLRALASQLQLAEEQERRRIAQDIHDSIGQILAFSSMEINTIRKTLPEPVSKSLKTVSEQLNKAVEQARTLSFNLSPSALYDLGFPVAVEDLVEHFSKDHNIPCRFEDCPMDLPMEEDVKIFLYRSVRELLINAAKHAKAGRIQVSLLRSGSQIHVVVEDNGRGFNPAIVPDTSKRVGGFGLFSIRERLNHIGGRLTIESAPGEGTKAVLIAPLRPDERDNQSEKEVGS